MVYKKPQVPSVHYSDFQSSMPNLAGKTFAITGTTSGTGKVAAQALASKGARLILLNRSSERSEKGLIELKQAYPSADIEQVDCDLQSFTAVRQAISQVKHLCPNGLYALINNAGIMAMPDQATEDGFDIQMQTNHLSHFLLSCELFPLLKQAAEVHGEARLINHSSIARLAVKKLETSYLEKRGGQLGGNGASMLFSGARWVRYGQTKLANAVFTAALHQKLQQAQSKVKALVAHPGFANTELQVTTNKNGGMSSWSSLGAKWISQSAEDGALGILSCAVLPEAQSGEFYGPGKGIFATKGKAIRFSLQKQCTRQDSIDLLWSKSCEAIEQEFVID